MKKLIIIANCDPRTTIVGGVGTYSAYLASKLSRKYEVIFIGKKQKTPQIKNVPYKVILANSRAGQNNIAFYRALQKLSKEIKTTKSTIIHAQRPDWLYAFKNVKGKKILTLHGSHFKNMKMKKGKVMQSLYKHLERKGIELADKVIAVDSETQKEYWNEYHLLARKIIMIPVGVDTKIFKPTSKAIARRRLELPKTKNIYLCVARLSKEKQIEKMIEAVDKDERLLVVGTGSEEKKLKKLAKQLKKRVRFYGAQPQDKLVEFYNASDALFIYSTHEGLPITSVEALSTGTPIISTLVGELPNIIKPGENGYLFEENPREVMDLVAKNSNKMKKKCRKTGLEYDWKKISERIVKEAYKK